MYTSISIFKDPSSEMSYYLANINHLMVYKTQAEKDNFERDPTQNSKLSLYVT